MSAWSCWSSVCCFWGQMESFVGFWRGLLSPVISLLLQQHAEESIPLPDPALLSCTLMYLLVFIQRVEPGLLVFLWEFEEWQVWWLSCFLKAGWFESWSTAAIHPPVMGAQGTHPQIYFSSSLGGCLHQFEWFSHQCLNSFPLWGKLLSCSNNIVAAATG